MAAKTKKVSFTLTSEDIAAIEKIANRTQRSKSQIIGLLARHEAVTPRPFLQPVKK